MLKTSYMVVPSLLLKKINHESDVSYLTQKILALFLESGNYQKHLRKLLLLSKRKRNIIVEELKKYKYSYSADSAGQHIIVDFGEDTEEIIKRAAEKKIKIYPIKDYYYKEISDRRIILGYAKMSIDKIKLGMKELLKK